MSQFQTSLDCVAVPHDQFAGRSAFRHLHDHQRIGADHDGRGDVADRHLRADLSDVRGQALAANVQLAAGDRGFGLNLRNLRFAVRILCGEPFDFVVNRD